MIAKHWLKRKKNIYLNTKTVKKSIRVSSSSVWAEVLGLGLTRFALDGVASGAGDCRRSVSDRGVILGDCRRSPASDCVGVFGDCADVEAIGSFKKPLFF